MSKPFMTTFVNIGEMIDRDNFYTAPVSKVSGQAFISLSASNQNSQLTDIPSTYRTLDELQMRDKGPPENDFYNSNNTWWKN